jgi:hypothetical protein
MTFPPRVFSSPSRRHFCRALRRTFGRVASQKVRAMREAQSSVQRLMHRDLAAGQRGSPAHPLHLQEKISNAHRRVPGGVFCLRSALAFHEITTQSAASVWIALPQGTRRLAISTPSLRVVRLSGASLTEGIEKHKVEGVPIRVYSAVVHFKRITAGFRRALESNQSLASRRAGPHLYWSKSRGRDPDCR